MFNETFWVAVGLFIFAAILVKFKVPAMILGALDARGTAVQAELDEAKRLRKEAEDLLASFKKRQVEAEQQAADIVAEAKVTAAKLAEEAKTKMDDFVARRTAQVELKIQQAETQALAEVRATAADLSVQAASHMIAQQNLGADLVSKGIAQIKVNFN